MTTPSQWPNLFPDPAVEAFADLRREVNLLSGRVDLTLRLLARIVGKLDPAFTESPHDPDVRRRSDLLTNTVIDKMRAEALASAASDPDQFSRLARYFKDIDNG